MVLITALQHILYIGDDQLNPMNHDTSRVIMPDSPFSTQVSPTNEPMAKPNTICIVLQHSKAAGNSALLPYSKVVGVFQNRKNAIKCMHDLRDKQQPLIRKEGGEAATRPEFWCTSNELDKEEGGIQYTSAYGEEFLVWIEEHDVQKQGGGGGRDVTGQEKGDCET